MGGELSMLQKEIAILKGEYAENEGPFQEQPSEQHQEEEEEQWFLSEFECAKMILDRWNHRDF